MNEAGRLLDEGASIEAIDKALVDFGFPVGPITLLDEVGIDVGGKVGLGAARGVRRADGARASRCARVVEAGRTGRKGGKGFYRYDETGRRGRWTSPSTSSSRAAGSGREIGAHEIVERCVLAMVNEAARCLEEGIIARPRDGDIGAVFGIGFPPFRGGPFRYIDTLGIPTVIRALEVLRWAVLAAVQASRNSAGDGLVGVALLSGSGEAALTGTRP